MNISTGAEAVRAGGGAPAPQPPLTDEAIALKRDAASFACLYERHVRAVYRYVASRVATREEAEDVTGDAFFRAWDSLSGYRGSGSFRAWLYGIVRRSLADHYRHARPRTSLPAEMAEILHDSSPGPEERALQREREQWSQALLAQLSGEPREILGLRFVAELSYPEIAQILGKREEAVKKIAYRAMAQLKRRQSL